MFSINCKLLQQILCDIRRALGIRKSAYHPVTISVDRDAVLVRVETKDTSIACQIPGGQSKPQTVTLPMQVLAGVNCLPKRDVSFDPSESGVRMSWWQDGQEVSQTVDSLPAVETPHIAPEWLLINNRRLGQVLRQAAYLTDPDSSRYSLGCIRIRGRDGQIAASDGRQAFTHSGFGLPVDEVLVPAATLKQLKCLDTCSSISVGRSSDWISLRMAVGPLRWLVDLKLANQGRFPNVDQCMPSPNSARCTLTIAKSDAEYLQNHLAKLFGKSSDIQPLTIDLSRDEVTGQQRVLLRFAGRSSVLAAHRLEIPEIDGRTTHSGRLGTSGLPASSDFLTTEPVELCLENSHYDLLPMQISMDYRHLLAALSIGFRQIQLGTPTSPVWCDAGVRRYVCSVMHVSQVQDTSPHAVSISTRRDLVAA